MATHQDHPDGISEVRLSELIWRTFKTRVFLLVPTILALLVLWSALVNGNAEVKKLNTEQCKQIVMQSPAPTVTEDFCDPSTSRAYIEGSRMFVTMLPPEAPVGKENTDKAYLDLKKQYEAARESFSDYDSKRRAAFRLQIQLSSGYSGSSVVLNSLSVAEVAPFCVLIIVAIVAVLGYQQRCYKTELSGLLKTYSSHREQLVGLARSQFFGGFPSILGKVPQIHPVSRFIVLSPENVAIWMLLIALGLTFFGVLGEFGVNVVHLTDSMFQSYPFALYSAAFLVCVFVVVTRSVYRSYFNSRSGAAAKKMAKVPSERQLRWITLGVSLIGFICLLFPWASGIGSVEDWKGYRFLGTQTPVHTFGQMVTYPMDPLVFREIRIQVFLALGFLGLCVLYAAFGPILSEPQKGMVGRFRALLAIGILFLSLNCVLYICLLEWQSMGDYVFPLGRTITTEWGRPGGYSLIWYDPSYGFLVFLSCCFFLVWVSLREGALGKSQSSAKQGVADPA